MENQQPENELMVMWWESIMFFLIPIAGFLYYAANVVKHPKQAKDAAAVSFVSVLTIVAIVALTL